MSSVAEKGAILAKATEVGRRVFEGMHLELVGVELERQRGGWFLRYFIDKPQGVTLDDCQDASRQISVELDVEDCIQGSYRLEISSPGLDRPLRTDEDFLRFRGRLAVIQTRDPLEGRRKFTGRLQSLESGIVTIVDNEGRAWSIPKAFISKARLEVEF